MRHLRIATLSGIGFVVAGLTAGFWLGRATAPLASPEVPTPPLVPIGIVPTKLPQTAPQTPAEKVAAIRASRLEQARLAGELLDWLIPIQRSGIERGPLTPPPKGNYDNLTAARAIAIFGELRYAPAADLMTRESYEGGIWWWGIDDVWADVPTDPRELSRQANAALHRPLPPRPGVIHDALVQMGPPVAAGLVDGYVRIWKMPAGEHKESRLREREKLLSNDSLTAAALVAIHKRITALSGDGKPYEVDLDELAALKRLKRGLLLKLEHPEVD